jgi:Tol biopolymer transport system component
MPFEKVTRVTGLSPGFLDIEPTLTADQRKLVYVQGSANVLTTYDLHLGTRTDAVASFDGSGPVTALNGSSTYESFPFLTADGGQLWFGSMRGDSGTDIYRATAAGETYVSPKLVTELNSSSDDNCPVLSADGKTIFFASSRPVLGTLGNDDIWTAHRARVSEPFGEAMLVPGINSPQHDWPSSLSPDGCRLYFTRYIPSQRNILVAERPK